MTAVLIDSSAWVDFFRGREEAAERIDPLLEDGRAAICGPVLAEVLSGATSHAAFERLRRQLSSLLQLEAPSDLWGRVAETRFVLARQGAQVHLLDLVIAVTAVASSAGLLTRDRDFEVIDRVLPLDLDLF